MHDGQLKDTKPALDNEKNLSIDHIKRKANSVTRCLAKITVHQLLKQVWIEDFLSFIRDNVCAKQCLF